MINPLTSLLSGSVVGIAGALGTTVLDFFKEKQRNKHDLAVMQATREALIVSANNAVTLETIKMVQGSQENDKATYWKEGAPFPLLLVEVLRGATRPLITIYFTVIATMIALWAFKRVGINRMVVAKIAEYSVYSALEMAGICIGWWFGSRGLDKMSKK